MEKKSNRDKFVELCQKRVIRAMKDIRLIGNLSNKTNYKYDDGDVRKIIGALDRELRDLKRRFQSKSGENGIEFRL